MSVAMHRGRRSPMAWLLAFFLLFAQLAGIAHGYSHAVDSGARTRTEFTATPHGDRNAPAPHFCSECLAFATCHSFIPATVVLPNAAAETCGVASDGDAVSTPLRREDCRTRAPPSLS